MTDQTLPISERPGPDDVPGTRRRPLFGTIVWGILLLGVAAFIAVPMLFGPLDNPALWVLGGIVVVGVILLISGVVAAVRVAK